MQIKKIAYAVALCSSVNAYAIEDFNINVYSTLDFGMVYRAGDDTTAPAGSQVDWESGVRSGSFLGVQGNQKISEDNTFIFKLESGFDLDDGTSTYGDDSIFGRQAWAGFTGSWGTAIAGRMDGGRASIARDYDPFGEGTVGNMSSTLIVVPRADQAVAYVSPRYNGWGIIAAYTNTLVGQEGTGNEGDNRVYAIIPSYKDGPLSLTFDFEHSWNAKSDAAQLYLGILAGSYDFGPFKLFGYYEEVHIEKDPAVLLGDQAAFMIGAQVPVGDSGLIKLSALRSDNKSMDYTCDKWSIGYEKEFNKGLVFYTNATTIDNNDNAQCTVGYSHNQVAHGTGAGGYGDFGLDIGISYSFDLY
ncbi:porin [Neptuniibacter sp. CAU 1671]|uniref:porin n=1 Tax=Neptuniibacter sp. CAU 1671 TaxID=3032593 RepID=UPI0023DC371A|nr:porin [Neptuniibacter sp. CAU 1671]MDF2180575.1 porin [Neptuniibacter sp. CAU 1671]